jgi:uncharacterized protein (TIGR00730 family)
MGHDGVKRICVFCGSNNGAKPAYAQAAREMGTALAKRKLGLVYGGAKVGLMGAVADAALAAGAEVVGVIPEVIVAKEVAHQGLTQLRRVGSMHERKQQMADLSDGFIAMPGGIGTFEEFCEILTWRHLGMHGKPCGLLNTEGYYDGFLEFLDKALAEGFMPQSTRSAVLVADNPEALLSLFETHRAAPVQKWIDRGTT